MRTSHWTWSAIILVVLVLLAAIQMLRVNQRRFSDPAVEQPAFYTEKGRLVNDTITIPAHEFYFKRLDLNRRVKLTGQFRTASLQNRVKAVVVEEKDFEDWKLQSDVRTLARTGSVPGGKIDLVLNPGTYLLIIDNRESGESQKVAADFLLE